MIRPYKPKDLPIIIDIANRAWREIYKSARETYGDQLFEILSPDETNRKGNEIAHQCAENPQSTFICQEDDKIVGFVTFMIHEETGIGEIGNNAVDPDCKLKGIGQQMYKAVLEYFRQLP